MCTDMDKEKTVYVCQACGYEDTEWSEVCPNCGALNRMVEGTTSA